ncbi:MAG: DUF2383 domain-containing protein [Alphaproteobacteria bacterium]|nr:DUF2383 domain-containing protein [Alphaproteobacteria bacterium]
MITEKQLESEFIKAIKDIIELDYNAIAAYEAAIDRLEKEETKQALQDFKKDHERHVEELSSFIKSKNEDPPTGPSLKSAFTKGKVMLANLIGDMTILMAMKSNEIDTNIAYERINNCPNIPEEVSDLLKQGLEDERRHLAWLEKNIF